MRTAEPQPRKIARPEAPGAPSTNRVLGNTCALLSVTLFFSAAVAATNAALNMPHPGFAFTLMGFVGLMWVTTRLRNRGNVWWPLPGRLIAISPCK